ncbi:hypothetical protein QZM89_32955 [Burkholderia gladioli]|uniref:hypothetical protein n=1 Tax=Burkholderia gladioli TaxID=28095 RepID=UPI0026564F0D|nr:hypothetical protein [Burkholderia gladioli]MDN7500008.1 hypothetical protein [Burkholderia gladioli]
MNDVMSVDITENSIGASPLQLTVDVVGDQVVVSGGGVVATFSWRVEGAAAAKRFAAQPMDHGPDANAENSFRVVLVDSPAQVVAERLTREQADELVRRITEGIKVQLGVSSEGVNDMAPTPEPMTLKDYALVAAGMVACLVLGVVLIVAPFVALYYFLKSVGLDGAANVLVNTGVLAIVMGVVIACLAMPFISLVRLVQAFQGGHRS